MKFSRDDYAMVIQEKHHAFYYEYMFVTCYLVKCMRDGKRPPIRSKDQRTKWMFTPIFMDAHRTHMWRVDDWAECTVDIVRKNGAFPSESPYTSTMWDDQDGQNAFVSFATLNHVHDVTRHFAQHLIMRRRDVHITDMYILTDNDECRYVSSPDCMASALTLNEPIRKVIINNQFHKEVLTNAVPRMKVMIANLNALYDSIELQKTRDFAQQTDEWRKNQEDKQTLIQYEIEYLQDRLHRHAIGYDFE